MNLPAASSGVSKTKTGRSIRRKRRGIYPKRNKFWTPYLKREGPVRLKRNNHLRMSVISLIGVTRVRVDLISYPRST